MIFLKTQSLRKSYSTRSILRRRTAEALKGIDLEIPQNESIIILGRNGAGKTTFMNICAGLLQPTAGSVLINGVSPVQYRSRIGYLPESIALPDFLTPDSFLKIMGTASGMNYGYLKNRISELISLFELEEALYARIHTLSMGNKRKLLIVQSLLHEPDVLILDEPTVYLDFIGKERFYQVLRELKENGCTIMISSHIITDIEKLGEKVVVLSEGSIIRTISKSELQSHKDLEQFIIAELSHEKN